LRSTGETVLASFRRGGFDLGFVAVRVLDDERLATAEASFAAAFSLKLLVEGVLATGQRRSEK